MSSRVTLADVARRAGVSRTAASFVLSGRTDMRIASATRERVLAAADELGYRPNLTARGLRTNVTGTIGLISDTIATTPYAGEVIKGAADTAFKHDRLIFVAETSGDPNVERDLLQEMLDRQVDAFLYAAMFTQSRQPPELLRGYPVVLLNCVAESFDAPTVLPDETEAGATAARALLDAGHIERIHVIGGRHDTTETPGGVVAGRERMAGINAALAKVGTAPASVTECVWHAPKYGYRAVSELLGHARPSALICFNDRLAFGAYQALHDHGLRVPDDVSVVSFDDSDLASWLRPALSSVALPHYELGTTAVTLLVENRREPGQVRVPMPLRARASIGPPATT
ncbi:LacI family DNA-binding transcriptional regulator [Haloechinothrix salitolerans]|uniref:LacI family DNA-binding transcriptional regulator n=1 Tax=Haloechinothrix salitolerans TaxID=926830 RepID=A0ABW2BS98_9PSEU